MEENTCLRKMVLSCAAKCVNSHCFLCFFFLSWYDHADSSSCLCVCVCMCGMIIFMQMHLNWSCTLRFRLELQFVHTHNFIICLWTQVQLKWLLLKCWVFNWNLCLIAQLLAVQKLNTFFVCSSSSSFGWWIVLFQRFTTLYGVNVIEDARGSILYFTWELSNLPRTKKKYSEPNSYFTILKCLIQKIMIYVSNFAFANRPRNIISSSICFEVFIQYLFHLKTSFQCVAQFQK